MNLRRSQFGHLPDEVVDLIVDNQWTVLRAWREHLNLSADVVAQRIDVTPKVYEMLERTEYLPADMRQLIAKALGISPEQLDV
ncbi:helix-turn-helix domain-containing protein [Herbaspirillum sp. GCM10030257]|uniref:helix-turn-helix domain-containing protein n=1 Tax=Herbaspirillum sp. GCM10030257 TaxID=3273393 RepID=UPI0036132093